MAISYSKSARVNAASRGKDLFACGFAEAKGKGLAEFTGPMDWRTADALFAFCHQVYSGKTPAEAFAAINWPEQAKSKPCSLCSGSGVQWDAGQGTRDCVNCRGKGVIS